MEKVTITREVLYELVWQKPMIHIAKEIGISDVGLRKICVKNKIPLPEYGHWQKAKVNRPTAKKRLPRIQDSSPIIIHGDLRNRPNNSEDNYRLKLLKQEIAEKYAHLLAPSTKSQSQHIFLSGLRKHLKERSQSRYYTNNHLIASDGNSHFKIQVSMAGIKKALAFLNLFFSLVKKMGHELKISNNKSWLTVNGYDLEISMREKLDRIPAKQYSFATYQFVPSGILCLKVGSFRVKEWSEQKTPLENQLPAIMAYIEITAEKDKAIQEYNRQQRELELQEKALLKEKFRLATREYEKFQRLVRDANRWNQTKIVREYLAHLAESKNPDFEWLIWAEKKANWLDPTINQVDELLGDYSPNPPRE